MIRKYFWFITLWAALSGIRNGWAGDVERIFPELGLLPNHSYSISDIESIDNASGKLSLHIPIAQLPAGAAGFAAGIDLVYNNKYWVLSRAGSFGELDTAPSGGWRLVMEPKLEREGIALADETPAHSRCNSQNVNLFHFNLTDTDGAMHTFYLSYPVMTQMAGCDDAAAYDMALFNQAVPSIWYTADGSFLRLEVDATTTGPQWPSNAAWTVFRQDGTSIRREVSGVVYLRDRNGNQITIEKLVDQVDYHEFERMSDEFGRKIELHHVNIYRDEVRQEGHNGTTLTWIVHYASSQFIDHPSAYICDEESVTAPLCSYSFPPPMMVTSVDLPNALTYGFSYDPYETPTGGYSNYRELRVMTLPTGATVEYKYRLDDHAAPTNWWQILQNSIKSKTVRIGSQIIEEWEYLYIAGGSAFQSVIGSEHTAPDGGVTEYEFNTLCYKTNCGAAAGTITQIGNPDGSIVNRSWQSNRPYEASSPHLLNPNPWIDKEWITTADSGATAVAKSVKVFAVDKNGNSTSVQERGWVPPGADPLAGTLLRKTYKTYVNGATDSTNTSTADPYAYSYGCSTCFTPSPTSSTPPTPRNLLESTEIRDSNDNVKSRSQYNYQESTPYRKVGNTKEEFHWDSTAAASISPGTTLTSGNSIVKSYSYTTRGNMESETDAKGFTTTYDYGNISCPGSTTYSDLYRTGMHQVLDQGSNPMNWSYSYNCRSGQRLSTTDPNSLSTTIQYDDYARPTMITEGSYSRTTHEYSDSLRRIITRKDVGTFNDQHNISIKHYDELGRLRLSRQLESYTDDPANESAGIRTDYKYVFAANRNETWISNPYRNSEPVAPTRGWTVKRYDKSGRLCVEEWFAGASNPSVATNCTPSSGTTGATVYGYNATVNYTLQTITDPAARSRNLYHDVLGRLIAVREDPGSAKYDTYYEYDLLDNLTLTRQVGSCSNPNPVSSPCNGGQTRTFAYSSLKRLTAATNPELGGNSISYSYDNNGNLIQKAVSGSQGVTVSFGYDTINRIMTRDYSDGITPPVTYCYDGRVWSGSFGQCNGTPATPSRQRLTEVGSTISRTSYGYNSWGNVITSTQTTAGQAYTFGYTYNAAGSLASITYPSGRIITTEYDDAGRPKNLKGTMGAAEKYYVGNPNTAPNRIQYASHGGISSMLLGNGILESRAYNSRLQPTQIQAGGLLSLLNCYQTSDSADCSGLAVQGNNGNVQRQKIIRGQQQPWVQEYTYDAVNRLASATETGVWSRTYGYDAFGNRWVAGWSGLSPSGLTPGSQNWFDPDTNRLVGTNNYDSRGNMVIYDGYTLSYDGDDRIISKSGATPSTKYEYDGEGRRVRAHSCAGTSTCTPGSGASTTVFVYDAFGKLAVEHRPDAAATGTNYYTHDHLGSTRLETDSAGNTVQISDYLPFGEEIPSGTGNRPSYASAENKIKFTGKERDSETGLDYFTARYLSAPQGRFMSPDPLPWLEWQHSHEKDGEEEQAKDDRQKFKDFIGNPQNFNMYTYVLNNPLTHNDPTGMLGCKVGNKEYDTCTITITYDPETSHGTLVVTGQNKGDKKATTLLTSDVVVGGEGHETPTGKFTASFWEKDHVSKLYGSAADTPWSKTLLGGNAFGPYQLHIKELENRGIFIHGTMGPGWLGTTWGSRLFVSPTSHGCVRMCNRDDLTLHDIMPDPKGNKIIIEANPKK
jgi:RHS repeat-associated protein